MFLIVIGVVVLVFLFMAIINRYRRCPSDKILVIYGNRGNSKSAKCVHGGGAFVWPIIEDYAYLSLTPIGIDANLTNALSRQNIRQNACWDRRRSRFRSLPATSSSVSFVSSSLP